MDLDKKYKKAVLTGLKTIIDIQVRFDHPIKDDFNTLVNDLFIDLEKNPQSKKTNQHKKQTGSQK